MRDSLFQVIMELEGFSASDRVQEAAVLQDELREAQQMVTRIRESAADATIREHGLHLGADLTQTPTHTLKALAEGFGR